MAKIKDRSPSAARPITSLEVSQAAGVSRSAVSRAFTPGARVAPDTQRRILEVADALGYRPNALARGLVMRRSHMVGLIVGESQNPFYAHALVQFCKHLQLRGKQAMLLPHEAHQDLSATLLRAQQMQLEAAVVFPVSLTTRLNPLPNSQRRFQHGQVPVVLFNRYLPLSGLPAVSCDNHAGGRLVAEVLLEAGAKRPAFVGGDPNTSTNRDRLAGFSSRLSEQAISLHATLSQAFSYEWGYAAARLLMNQAQPPDALFGANDIIALGVLDGLRQRGVRVPEEVSVIGFDGIQEGAFGAYQLTTVAQPLEGMIERTLELVEWLQSDAALEPEVLEVQFLPGSLVRRATVAALSLKEAAHES